jgi:hypothetical protein
MPDDSMNPKLIYPYIQNQRWETYFIISILKSFCSQAYFLRSQGQRLVLLINVAKT